MAGGIVSFDARPVDDGFPYVGDELNFAGVGEGRSPTVALVIPDYCRKYYDMTTDESED